MHKHIILIAVICLSFIVFVTLVVIGFRHNWGNLGLNLGGKNKTDSSITDFASCAKKYPVQMTYPEQCRTPDGRTFTQ